MRGDIFDTGSAHAMDCKFLFSMESGTLKVNRVGSFVDKMKLILHYLDDEEEK